MTFSPLLSQFSGLFAPKGKPILDLACGSGRNGLYLHEQGLPIQFIDKNEVQITALQIEKQIAAEHCFILDLESGKQVLTPNSYQGILVFRYLHRPLITQIKAAIEPGGIIIYETFTVANRQFGRPHRDAFLLQQDELKSMFEGWQCLHYFEGIKHNPDRAIAQIVCQKPFE